MKKLNLFLLGVLLLSPLVTLAETTTQGNNSQIPVCYSKQGTVLVTLMAKNYKNSSGTKVDFKGDIRNTGTSPVVEGKLLVKITKSDASGQYTVDSFIAKDNVSINASTSVPVDFSWNIPAYALSGIYQVTASFVVGNGFNLNGVSPMDGTVSFEVVGEQKSDVSFDQSKTKINNQAENTPFAILNKSESANITFTLTNKTKTLQRIPVSFNLYKWDDQSQSNLLKSEEKAYLVNGSSSMQVTYSVTDTSHAVSQLVAVSSYQDQKSEAQVRLIRNGVSEAKVGLSSITTYPVEKDKENTITTCINVANYGTDSGKIVTKVYDFMGSLIYQNQQEGVFNNLMQGITTKFTPQEAYKDLTVETQIYDKSGTLLDDSKTTYKCTTLSNDCKEPSLLFNMKTLLTLLGIIVILLIIFLIKRKMKVRVPVSLILILLASSLMVMPKEVGAQAQNLELRLSPRKLTCEQDNKQAFFINADMYANGQKVFGIHGTADRFRFDSIDPNWSPNMVIYRDGQPLDPKLMLPGYTFSDYTSYSHLRSRATGMSGNSAYAYIYEYDFKPHTYQLKGYIRDSESSVYPYPDYYIESNVITSDAPSYCIPTCGSTLNSCSAMYGTTESAWYNSFSPFRKNISQYTPGIFNDVPDTATSYLWNCVGAGTTASCSLPRANPSTPSCGTTNNICIGGTFTDVTDTSTNYLWSCANNGTTTSCSLPKEVTNPPASCGTVRNTCSAGILGSVNESSAGYFWNCVQAVTGHVGSDITTTANCSIPKTAPTPSCGTTNNTCSVGTFTDVTDTSTNYLWSCANNGTTTSCSLPKTNLCKSITTPVPPTISVSATTVTTGQSVTITISQPNNTTITVVNKDGTTSVVPDTNSDPISYQVDWGDGVITTQTSPVTKSWSMSGVKTIKVRAMNTCSSATSNWTSQDITVTDIPTNLTPVTLTKSDSSTCGSISLNWTDNGARSYQVFRKSNQASDTGYVSISGLITGTTFTDRSSLINGVTYTYEVWATDGVGAIYSNQLALPSTCPSCTPDHVENAVITNPDSTCSKWVCNTSDWSWSNTATECPAVPDTSVPAISAFKFSPNFAGSDSRCKLYLSASNVKSCVLKNNSGNADTQLTVDNNNQINVLGTQSVVIGKYTLWCTGLASSSPLTAYGSKSCYSNSTFKEN